MMRGTVGLPLRVALRATGLALGVAVGVAEEALGVAGRLAEALISRSQPPAEPEVEFEMDLEVVQPDVAEPLDAEVAEPEAAEPPVAEPPAGEPPVAEPEPAPPPVLPPAHGRAGPTVPEPAEPTVPEIQEPRHVSEVATLVASVAEPGAADGAGAQVHVEEPWEGYRAMTAAEVIARLAALSPEELAAVELYEQTARRRLTVLRAVERELRRR